MGLGACAGHGRFVARSLHCGLRPPVERTKRFGSESALWQVHRVTKRRTGRVLWRHRHERRWLRQASGDARPPKRAVHVPRGSWIPARLSRPGRITSADQGLSLSQSTPAGCHGYVHAATQGARAGTCLGKREHGPLLPGLPRATRRNGADFSHRVSRSRVERTAGPAEKGPPTTWQGDSLEAESCRGGCNSGEPSRPRAG